MTPDTRTPAERLAFIKRALDGYSAKYLPGTAREDMSWLTDECARLQARVADLGESLGWQVEHAGKCNTEKDAAIAENARLREALELLRRKIPDYLPTSLSDRPSPADVLRECATEIAMALVQASAILDKALAPPCFRCPNCGPQLTSDEDGCCRGCGEDIPHAAGTCGCPPEPDATPREP